MKKLFLIFLTLALILSFAACQSNPAGNDQPNALTGSLEDILGEIYETAELSDSFKEYIMDGLQTTVITAERCEYYLGKAGIEFEEAIASEPIMMPSAYELDLVRVKEGADVEAIKNEIKENVNPMKWICVGIDPENVIVDNIDDVIIVILSDNEGKALHDAFLALKE
jgi:ABC-type Fe3+-hydroxamate transport system substrate-binding protein